MKFISILGLTALCSSVKGNDIPDPPSCIFDCPMFDLITIGEVDDCAVSTAWISDDCMDDCGTPDIMITENLITIFCSASYASHGGDYGSGHGSYESPSDSDTCQDTVYDVQNICPQVQEILDIYMSADTDFSGCADLLAYGIVDQELYSTIVEMCPESCIDVYAHQECQCSEELYTCSSQDPPPCQNYEYYADELGNSFCDGFEGIFGSSPDETATCTDIIYGGTSDYAEFTELATNFLTFCPLLCDTCDGFTIPSDTCQDSVYDVQGICPQVQDILVNFEGCADLLTYGVVDQNIYNTIVETCPETCIDVYEQQACQCSEELYTCASQDPPPCQNYEYYADELGNSFCDGFEGIFGSSPDEAVTCLDIIYGATGSDYDDFTEVATNFLTFCPLLCDTCEGFTIPEKSAPIIVTLAMELTFENELTPEAQVSVCDAISGDVADGADLDPEWVSCAMELGSGGRRRLLSVVYETVISITVEEFAFVAGGQDLLDDLAVVTTDESLADIVTSIAALPELAEANGGESPTTVLISSSVVDPNDSIPQDTAAPSATATAAPSMAAEPSAAPSAAPTAAPTTVPGTASNTTAGFARTIICALTLYLALMVH